MLLGVPLDYRNQFDLSNAVGTFGKFLHWHQEDPIKARARIYAAFPSPQLVPQDIVFGDYGHIGGVRQSWTTPCYVLTADFAEVLPADDEQILADRNPHPMPGNLHHNGHMWALPQFPEIGWNDIPVEAEPN